MEIIEDPKDASFVLSRFRPKEREGIHVHDLLFCMRKTYLQKKGLLPPTDEDLVYWVIGQGYHKLLEGEISEFELPRDGIIGTIDTILLEGRTVVPVEFKSTRASSRKSIEEMPHWIEQIKAYCYIVGTLEVRLRVLYLMGNYRGLKPQFKSYRIKFTKEEIDSFWQELLSRKRELENALERSELPPPKPRYVWECERCSRSSCMRGSEGKYSNRTTRKDLEPGG